MVGGRSAGARSAARCAATLGAAAYLALAFPLHPPGKPERSRLRRAGRRSACRTLVIQGERDPFGRPEEFPEDVDLTVVPGADHALPRAEARTGQPGGRRWALVVEATLEWVVREVAGNRNAT